MAYYDHAVMMAMKLGHWQDPTNPAESEPRLRKGTLENGDGILKHLAARIARHLS